MYKLLIFLNLLFFIQSSAITLLPNLKVNQQKFKTQNYQLNDMSGTIPYKLYLIIQELKNSDFSEELFLNRLILYGPPGNGKSTYARKIATEIDAIIFEISGPSIVNQYQGSGADNINTIFNDAIETQKELNKKVVIFIDEIDAIANSTNKDKRADDKAAVQALWLKLDEIKKNPNIFVILATNEFSTLNPILLDRFGDNIIEVPNPDFSMRKEVIEFFIKKFGFGENQIKIDKLAKMTNGYSIRAIEDALRSIKRIAKVENNGIANDEIIEQVLKTFEKKKPSKLQEIILNLPLYSQKILLYTGTTYDTIKLIIFIKSLIINKLKAQPTINNLPPIDWKHSEA